MTPRIDETLRNLRRAIRRLAPDQGPRARRNARSRALAALRAVRAAVDEAYPPLRQPGSPRAQRVSAMAVPQGMKDRIAAARLRRDGYEPSEFSDATIAAFAAMGVPIRERPRGTTIDVTWLPEWVLSIWGATPGSDLAKKQNVARFARMTPRQRRARLAEMALRSSSDPAGQ